MNKEINLIYGKRKDLLSHEKRVNTLRWVAIGSVLFIIVCGVGIFLINQFFSLPVVLQKEQTATQTLSFLQKKAGKLLLLKSRLRDIDTIEHNRFSLDEKIATITKEIPSNVSIDNLSISNKSISLALSSDSLDALNTVINFVTTSVTKKQLFSKVTINSVGADERSGKYTLSIDGEPL